MKPLYLEMSGFFSYKHAEIAFPKSGALLLSGKYGSGKSSLPEALMFALTGEFLRKIPTARAIRCGSKKAEVKLVFEAAGKTYRIERSLTRTKGGAAGKLALFVQVGKDWAPVEAPNKGGLEEKLASLIGFSPLVLKTAVFFTKRFQFVSLPDPEKKAILDDLIPDLKSLQVGAKNTKASMDAAREQLRDQQGEHARFAARLEDLNTDLKDLDVRSTRWGEDRADRVLQRQKDWDAASRALVGLEHSAPRSNGQETSSDLDSAVAPLVSRIAEIEQEVEKLQLQERAFNEEGVEASTLVASIRGDIEALADAGRCYACDQDVTEDHIAHRRGVLEATLAAEQDRCARAREQAKRLRVKLSELGEERRELSGKKAQLEQQMDRERREVDHARQQYEFDLRQAKAAEAGARKALREAEREENPYLEAIEKKADQVQDIKAQIVDATGRLEKTRDAIAHLEFCEKAFGNQGLRSYLLDCVMPVLTQEASRHARALSQDQIDLRFVTQTAIGSGELRDKLDLEVENKEGAESYSGSSFGEQARIDLAVALALHTTAEARAGKPLGLLVVDELADSIDPLGADAAIECLQEMAKSKLVLVISHRPEMKSRFQNVMLFKKTAGESEVTVR